MVAKEIELSESSQTWARKWCAVAQKTNDMAGDGTTTDRAGPLIRARALNQSRPAWTDGPERAH